MTLRQLPCLERLQNKQTKCDVKGERGQKVNVNDS